MLAAHEWASLLGFILLIGSQESFWPLTLHCLWTELFHRHCSESCLNEKYSLACLLWESCTACQQGYCKGKQQHCRDTSPSKTPKGIHGFGMTPPHWRGVNHFTAYQWTVDLEKGIKHISLTGSGQGGHWQHLCDSLVVSSPGCGFSAVPCGDSSTFTAFPSIIWVECWLLICCWISAVLLGAHSPELSERGLDAVPRHAGHLQHTACSKALSSGSFEHTSQDLSGTINYGSSISSN